MSEWDDMLGRGEFAPRDYRKIVEEVGSLVDRIEEETRDFMEQYKADADGFSERMSGESAALTVAERSQIVTALRAVLRGA